MATADYLISKSWWSLWPIALWSAAFTAHYFYCKALSADDGWAEERAADLRSKSYDASHIESIAQRYQARPQDEPQKPKD